MTKQPGKAGNNVVPLRGTPTITAQSVGQVVGPERSESPAALSGAEAETWQRVMRARPPGWFDPACHPLLVEYCRTVAKLDQIEQAIRTNPLPEALDAPRSQMRRWSGLMNRRSQEASKMLRLAKALRLGWWGVER